MSTYLNSSKTSQWILILGLIALALPNLFSFIAIFGLEQAVTTSRVALQTRGEVDEINERIKDWALLAQNPKLNSDETLRKQKNTLETQIAESFARGEQRLKTDSEQLTRLVEIREEWLQVQRDGEDMDLSQVQGLDRKFNRIDERELDKVTQREPEMVAGIHFLIVITIFLSLVSMFLVAYGLFSMRRANEERNRFVIELKELQEAALTASALKSKFLATVSHEIRTPLNGIIGLSDVIQKSQVPERERKLVEVIHQSGKTLLKIINDILDFSKIESGRIELESTEFSVVQVLNQVLFTLSRKSEEKGLSLSYDLDPRLPQKMMGDADRLTQVLFNLVGNAIKFTSLGSVIVRVHLLSSEKSSEASKIEDVVRIQFSVEDTGIGLNPAQLKSLFQPFVQLQKTGTSGEPGTGLGLSICQHLVHAMGGDIGVESDLGRGSRFVFSLVFSAASADQVGQISQIHLAKRVDSPGVILPLYEGRFRPHILVVEDNPTNQLIAQTMLSRLGAEAVIASDGREALVLARQMKFHLILMDCQMPVLDGYEATEALRREGSQVPIVAMTANAASEEEAKCLAVGMNGFIAKPVTMEPLRKVLSQFIQERYDGVAGEVLQSLGEKIGPEAVQRVVDSYLKTLKEFSEMSQRFLQTSDLNGLNRLGHRFKSSSLTVGAIGFADLCSQLEFARDFHHAKALTQTICESANALEKNFNRAIVES